MRRRIHVSYEEEDTCVIAERWRARARATAKETKR
jgi:hypothetical protein